MTTVKLAISALVAITVSSPAAARYVESDPIGQAAGPSTYSYGASNPLRYSDPFGLDVTMTCRPLSPAASLGWGVPQHCSVMVWHWVKDKCGHRHKVITAQYSLPYGGTRPAATPPSNDTYQSDRNAFYNPGGDNENYDIAPPAGMSQAQFDNSVTQAGANYSQGPYSLTGPNSNTAAATIIYQGGQASVVIPDVPGAVAEYYYIAPPWPMGR